MLIRTRPTLDLFFDFRWQPIMTYVQEPHYFSISTPLGEDTVLLRAFRGEERISGLYRISVELQSEDRGLDFSSIVGQRATITVDLEDESQRYIDGYVGRFVQAGTDGRFATYLAELFPWLWFLTLSTDCEIFQNLTVPAILEKVFGDFGQTDYETRLTGTYETRDYCVQYNETAFDFVSRLMEDEGIFYFFEHTDGKHTLILADDPSDYSAVPGGGTLGYGHYGNWVQQNIATAINLEQSVIAGASSLDDFNFETPTTELVATTESTAALAGAVDAAKRELYEYPGGFVKKDVGESRAKLRVEEQEAGQKTVRGESYCRALTSGHTFTLEGHYREDANAEYVVRSVYHSASREGYSNSFVALGSQQPFRPPRSTRRPFIAGTQTALVVGKSGEEIWTDKYGRVKVKFHWDRAEAQDETASCWVRVAQGWAGNGWGQFFLPRIGQEVVVTFLEGDPDRPLITGSVYNAEQVVPYTLPDDQTKSTVKSRSSKESQGYNELRFEDKTGEEEVYFQAERDFNRVVKNNDTLTVGLETQEDGDQTIEIYNNRSSKLQEGSDLLEILKGDRTVKVVEGSETLEVGKDRSLTIAGKETHAVTGDREVTIDGNYTLTVGGDLTIAVTGKVSIQSTGAMALESSDAFSAEAATSLSQKAGTELTNEAGTSLKNASGTDLTTEAGTSLALKAGADFTLQGSASGTVDGGAMLTVKGGLVKIN
jgi:type VI secretion system secreted protein VgrG